MWKLRLQASFKTRWENSGLSRQRFGEVKFTPRSLGDGVKTNKSQHHKKVEVANRLATGGRHSDRAQLRFLNSLSTVTGVSDDTVRER